MYRNYTVRTIAPLIVLSTLALSACTPKANLALHLNAGDKRSVIITETNSQKLSAQGMNMEMGQTTETSLRFDITEVGPDGVASAKATFKRVTQDQFFNAPMPGMDQLVGGAMQKPIQDALRTLADQSFTLTLTPQGRAQNVQGMDEIAKQLVEKLEVPAGPMQGMLKPALQNQLRAALSNAGFEAELSNLFAVFPPAPVAVNAAWTDVQNVKGQLPMKIERSLTLKKIEAGTASIETTSKVSMDPGALPDMGLFKGKLELTGQEVGALDVDVASGWIKLANFTQTMSGNLQMEASAFMPKPMSIPLTIERKVRIETFPES